MPEQKQDILKEHLNQWMLRNVDTYHAFEKLMNEQSNEGYQKILLVATTLFPAYRKLIEKKIHSKESENIGDIETFLTEEQIEKKFLEQLNLNDKETSLPAMLSWLYFGRSFENMVERGEELLNNRQTNRFYKSIISKTIKMIINQSIKLNLRTQQNWIDYQNLQTAIKENTVFDWALLEKSLKPPNIENRSLEKKSNNIPLDEMILLTAEEKTKLLSKINKFLQTGVKGKRVAFMIIALRQLGYLPTTTTNRQLFTAIKQKFNTYIGSDKSIYQYLDDATAKQFQSEIDILKIFFQVN